MRKVKGGKGGEIHLLEKGETANPNGRPRKTINSVNKELEEQGIKPATANEIKDIYLRLINMEIAELKKLVEDLKQPALIRIVGKKILSDKGFDIIDKMLDRAIGKAQQAVDVTTNGKELTQSPYDLSKLSVKALKELQNAKTD